MYVLLYEMPSIIFSLFSILVTEEYSSIAIKKSSVKVYTMKCV